MIDSIEIPPLDKIKTENEKNKDKKKKTKKKKSKSPINQNLQSLNTEDIVNYKPKENKSKEKKKDNKPSAYKSFIKQIRSSAFETNRNKSSSPFSKSLNMFYRVNTLDKEENENTSNTNLRNNFQKLLGKLNDNNTKYVSFNQLKDLIKKNNTQEGLRIYLSCLSKYDPTSTMKAKEIYVLLLGYISTIYKENLKDPLDKPPNLIKTINRILNCIKQFYINQNSYIVHKSCSHSICELYDNCMPKNNINKIYLHFIQPFIDIISTGNDNISQEGSAIYLSDFIYHLGSEKNDVNNKLLDTLDDKIIHLCTKSSLDIPYLFESLYNLIQFTPIENYKKFIDDLYQRFIYILCKVNRNKYNIETKIFCLKILSLIASKVKNNKDIIKDFYEENIIKIIESNIKDKVIKVQNAAKEALINWYELKDIIEEKENEDKKIENENEDNSNLENKNYPNRKMDKLNFLRDIAKMAKKENNKIDYDSELPQKMKEEVYKKGIGNILQLSRFLNTIKNKANENQLRNSSKKINNKKKEINDFLKQTKQIKKYNEYKKEEENNINKNKFGFQIEDVKSGDQAENPFINKDSEIEENINEEDEKSENNKLKNKKIEKNKSNKKKKKKKIKKIKTEEFEEDENENKSVKKEENKENENNEKEGYEIYETNEGVNVSEINEENEEFEDNKNNENINENINENNNEINIEENEINENSNKKSQNEEKSQNYNTENNDLFPIENNIIIESEKENDENKEEEIEIENENKSFNNKSKSDLNSRRIEKKTSKKEEEINNNNNFYDTNKEKLEQILNENKSNKKSEKSNKKYSKKKEKHYSDEESDTDNYLEDNQSTKQENQKIIRQGSKKSNEFNKLKQSLQLILNNKIFKSINNFEKKINSKLDKIKNRIDNVSEKILKYDKNKNKKTKEKNKKEEDALLKQKTLMYKEVLNDIKNDLLSSQRNKNEINNDSEIMKIWKDALNNIEKNNYNDAYNLILNSGDDIYLLRLIYLTGIIFDKLSPEICRNVLKRINMITRSYQIQSLLINLVKNSVQCNMFNILNENEQNDILDTLYEIAGNNSPISKEASEIYTYITQ